MLGNGVVELLRPPKETFLFERNYSLKLKALPTFKPRFTDEGKFMVYLSERSNPHFISVD